MSNQKNGNRKNLILSLLLLWVFDVMLASCVILALNLSEKNQKIAFLIALPGTLLLTIITQLIIRAHIKNKYKPVNKLIEMYGPGEKCAEEIKILISKQRNPVMRISYSLILANLYLGDMADADRAFEVLNSIDKIELFKNHDAAYLSFQCNYYYLCLTSYGLKENNEAILSIYNEALPLFQKFYAGPTKKLMWDAVQCNVEKAKGNYDEALKLVMPYMESSDQKVKNAAMLDTADLYIITGQMDEAEVLLKSFNPKENNVAANKCYERIVGKYKEAKKNII